MERREIAIQVANLLLELGGVRMLMLNLAVQESSMDEVKSWSPEEFEQYAFDRLVDDLELLPEEILTQDIARMDGN